MNLIYTALADDPCWQVGNLERVPGSLTDVTKDIIEIVHCLLQTVRTVSLHEPRRSGPTALSVLRGLKKGPDRCDDLTASE